MVIFHSYVSSPEGSLVTKHCWWFWMFVDQGFTKDTWLLGCYGDRSRWRGPLFWSFLNNLNKHPICRKPSHLYHFFLDTYPGTSERVFFHILEPQLPRTQFQGQLLCVSDLGLGKNIVECCPHLGWWWSCQELKAVVETVNDEQLAEAAPFAPKKRAWKGNRSNTKPWFCQWAVLIIIIIIINYIIIIITINII